MKEYKIFDKQGKYLFSVEAIKLPRQKIAFALDEKNYPREEYTIKWKKKYKDSSKNKKYAVESITKIDTFFPHHKFRISEYMHEVK